MTATEVPCGAYIQDDLDKIPGAKILGTFVQYSRPQTSQI